MKQKNVLLSLLLVFALGSIAFAVAHSQKNDLVDSTACPDSYSLTLERTSGTYLHTLQLDAGEPLQIHFETTDGTIHMELTAPDGTVLYSGDGREVNDFTVTVPESGAYPVTVKAHRASGCVHIRQKESTP